MEETGGRFSDKATSLLSYLLFHLEHDFQHGHAGTFPAKILVAGIYFQLLTGRKNQRGKQALEKEILVYCQIWQWGSPAQQEQRDAVLILWLKNLRYLEAVTTKLSKLQLLGIKGQCKNCGTCFCRKKSIYSALLICEKPYYKRNKSVWRSEYYGT